MTDLFKLILGILVSRFKARATLGAENLVLRPQVNVLRRRTPKTNAPQQCGSFSICLVLSLVSVRPLEVVAIVRPETIIRWHRAGFSGVLAPAIPQPRWQTEGLG